MQAIVETLFDTVYLISAITIGILMIRKSKGNRQFTMFGIMAVLLGSGDAFYIPVVLWADVIPMIGMLMIPKTCAYVWTVVIGYNAMKKEIA